MNFKQTIQVHDEDIVAPSKLGKVGLHSKFVSRVSCKHSWIDTGSWATLQSYLEENRSEKIADTEALLKTPPVEGNNVLLQLQSVKVKDHF